ncbi:MAG: hypothetical protein IPH84_18540 [Bacteroidales bacterium]|nr:hypothetical protein [Bacteroidales bacterium]
MFISNLTHFLDDDGNIAQKISKIGRERACFIAIIVDEATKPKTEEFVELRCMKKKCEGIIEIEILQETEEIEYWCTHCPDNNGKISGWQGTKWDNRKY